MYVQLKNNSVAPPKNTKKPTTSVTVVRITEPASAGSMPILSNILGMNNPDNEATAILMIIAKANIPDNK